MRTLVLGDIHGCFIALTTLVTACIRDDDRLIALGDYVDRGPDSRQVLDWLVQRAAQDNLIALMGNHELMMLTARMDSETYGNWMLSGGDTTLESYLADGEVSLELVPKPHWDFLQQCRSGFQTDTHIFVHASLDPDLPLADQSAYMLYWEKFNDPPPHESGKTMVCGHTPQSTGHPISIGHAVCIDTGVYKPEGWLTCLDVATDHYWQANQRGELREGDINEESLE